MATRSHRTPNNVDLSVFTMAYQVFQNLRCCLDKNKTKHIGPDTSYQIWSEPSLLRGLVGKCSSIQWVADSSSWPSSNNNTQFYVLIDFLVKLAPASVVQLDDLRQRGLNGNLVWGLLWSDRIHCIVIFAQQTIFTPYGCKLGLAMRLRIYAVHADDAHIRIHGH